MAEQTEVRLRWLSIVTAGRERDVAVDERAHLGDVLDQLGLPEPGEQESTGAPSPSETTGGVAEQQFG